MPQPQLLLVDDEPEIAFILQRLARRANQQAVTCVDAESAWSFLESVQTGSSPRPDLVLLDVNLPGMSGVDLCRKMKACAALSTIAVAMFSHPSRLEDLQAGLDAGADFFIAKELLCQPSAWAQRVSEILEGRDGRKVPESLGLQHVHVDAPSWGGWLDCINQAFQSAPLRALDGELLDLLIRHAARRIGLESPPFWWSSIVPGLDVSRLGTAVSIRTDVQTFTTAVAEVLWRVSGSATSRPLYDALDSPSRLR
jgi:DNA-binding response OmpR family regulator